MRAKISATELGRGLSAVLNRVRRQGLSFLIKQDSEAVATLEPLGAPRGVTWRTLKAALRTLLDADPDFAADLEEVHRNQPKIPNNVRPN